MRTLHRDNEVDNAQIAELLAAVFGDQGIHLGELGGFGSVSVLAGRERCERTRLRPLLGSRDRRVVRARVSLSRAQLLRSDCCRDVSSKEMTDTELQLLQVSSWSVGPHACQDWGRPTVACRGPAGPPVDSACGASTFPYWVVCQNTLSYCNIQR